MPSIFWANFFAASKRLYQRKFSKNEQWANQFLGERLPWRRSTKPRNSEPLNHSERSDFPRPLGVCFRFAQSAEDWSTNLKFGIWTDELVRSKCISQYSAFDSIFVILLAQFEQTTCRFRLLFTLKRLLDVQKGIFGIRRFWAGKIGKVPEIARRKELR